MLPSVKVYRRTWRAVVWPWWRVWNRWLRVCCMLVFFFVCSKDTFTASTTHPLTISLLNSPPHLSSPSPPPLSILAIRLRVSPTLSSRVALLWTLFWTVVFCEKWGSIMCLYHPDVETKVSSIPIHLSITMIYSLFNCVWMSVSNQTLSLNCPNHSTPVPYFTPTIYPHLPTLIYAHLPTLYMTICFVFTSLKCHQLHNG